MKKIGIPRAMLYYENNIFWKDYFEGIGCEIVLSEKTNKDILDCGILNSVDEACLPVKILHGHVDSLRDKVDYIFIPKIISLHKREYCCPKILGLPDMVKNSIDDLPEIIDSIFDLSNKNGFIMGYLDIGKRLNISPVKSLNSFKNAQDSYSKYDMRLKKELFKKYRDLDSRNMNILVLGHTYNIYDEFINMDIINKLTEKKVNIYTAEYVSEENIRKFSNTLKKRMFWTHGRRIIGAANYYIMNHMIDGIIYLSSFGCGLDSVLTYIVSKESWKHEIPFMNLTLDEQTGEAGMNTRIEAFLDMMNWREKNESHISTFR